MSIDEFVRPKACETCPFNEGGPGRDLRDNLEEGRFDSILADLRKGKSFKCHEDLHMTPRRRKRARICAGSIAWQRKNGCVPDAVQVIERLDAMMARRRPRF